MFLEEAHNLTDEQFYNNIETLPVSAVTNKQQATIDAYTLPDVPGLMTLVSPTELRNLSAMFFRGYCHIYLCRHGRLNSADHHKDQDVS